MLASIGAAVGAWLASQGASLVLGALAKLILDALASRQAAQAQRDAGARDVIAKVNQRSVSVQNEMDEVAPSSSGDVADRLRRGTF